MDYKQFNLTPFEKDQLSEIEKWVNKTPSKLSLITNSVLKPFSSVINKIVPPSAIEGAIACINKVSEFLADTKDIKRDGDVTNISELKTKNLELSTHLANEVHKWAVGGAMVEGGSTGFFGVAGLIADIPALMTLSIRTIHKIALCYGYECNSKEDEQFILAVLQAANSSTEAEKTTSITVLQCLSLAAARNSWKKIAIKAGEDVTGKSAMQMLEQYISKFLVDARQLSKMVSKGLTKNAIKKGVPVVSAIIGATSNAKYVNDVAWAARYMYEQRWLIENGKIIPEIKDKV